MSPLRDSPPKRRCARCSPGLCICTGRKVVRCCQSAPKSVLPLSSKRSTTEFVCTRLPSRLPLTSSITVGVPFTAPHLDPVSEYASSLGSAMIPTPHSEELWAGISPGEPLSPRPFLPRRVGGAVCGHSSRGSCRCCPERRTVMFSGVVSFFSQSAGVRCAPRSAPCTAHPKMCDAVVLDGPSASRRFR